MNQPAIVGLVMAVVFLVPFGAAAQDSGAGVPTPAAASSESLGLIGHGNPPPVVRGDTTTVQHGNATIVFEPAGSQNLDSAKFAEWSSFAAAHPEIARAVEFHPSVTNDPAFLRSHPTLAEFYQAHPDVQQALIADPGNFEAIPPRPGE